MLRLGSRSFRGFQTPYAQKLQNHSNEQSNAVFGKRSVISCVPFTVSREEASYAFHSHFNHPLAPSMDKPETTALGTLFASIQYLFARNDEKLTSNDLVVSKGNPLWSGFCPFYMVSMSADIHLHLVATKVRDTMGLTQVAVHYVANMVCLIPDKEDH